MWNFVSIELIIHIHVQCIKALPFASEGTVWMRKREITSHTSYVVWGWGGVIGGIGC